MAHESKVDLDDDQKGYRWETEYERTWEAIKETEDGLLQPSIDDMITKAKRQRILTRRKIRLGMMRHLFIIIDMSETMLEPDIKPTRIKCVFKILENFLKDFFDLNPISQISLMITRNKRRERITELSGNPKQHLEGIAKLSGYDCIGEPSLQNSLESCLDTLRHMPGHTSKEVLVIFGSLTTCDPGDINETIESLKNANIRCSIIGLAAEVRVCHNIAKNTKGTYNVALDESHIRDLIYDHLNPPPATANTESSLIKMGFPQYFNEGDGKPSMCVCHLNGEINFSMSGYFCPQCNSKYCDLPIECQVCGLPLVSSTHLSRSYHHLFPVDLFQAKEFTNPVQCFACQTEVTNGSTCNNCNYDFCVDCDLFIHETMHLCPGCSSKQS